LGHPVLKFIMQGAWFD